MGTAIKHPIVLLYGLTSPPTQAIACVGGDVKPCSCILAHSPHPHHFCANSDKVGLYETHIFKKWDTYRGPPRASTSGPAYFLPARRYASAGYSDRNVSVRLSVCLSVTRRYCVKTKKASVMISSPSGSPKTLVF